MERKEKLENFVEVIETSLDESDKGLGIRNLVNDFQKVNNIFLILTDNIGNVIYFSQNQSGMMNRMMNNGMMRRGHNIFSNNEMNNFIENSERFTIEFQGVAVAFLLWYTGRDANISERAAIFSRRVNRIILLAGILVAIITIIISVEMQTELRNFNLELRELLVSDKPDEDIANIKNKINMVQNNLLDLKTDYWLGLGEVLTEEQIEQAKELFVNQEDGVTYPRGGMRMYGFREQRMHGRGFYGGGRSQMFPNSRMCPFGF